MKTIKKESIRISLTEGEKTLLCNEINFISRFIAEANEEGIDLKAPVDLEDDIDVEAFNVEREEVEKAIEKYREQFKQDFKVTIDVDNAGFKGQNREGVVLMQGEPDVVLGVTEAAYPGLVKSLIEEGIRIRDVVRVTK